MGHRALGFLAAIAALSGVLGQDSPTFGTTVVVPGGLRGSIYFIPQNTAVLPDFGRDDLERAGEIWTDSLNILPRHWTSGFPGLTERFEWFALDYSGRFWIEKPGRYTFALLSDDGSRLYLDDVPAIDNDCQHPPDLRIAAVKLEGGVHTIRVSYFQGPRDCISLLLAIAGPDGMWRVFNTRDFTPPSNPETWNYPGASSVTIVPTTPEEASLSIDRLIRRLTGSGRSEKHSSKSKTRGCLYDPVRFCGK
ncbi:MAG TPA: PA14 domain-containing protein [Bryobacteraceae bacterium]|nr:PA14 domain-containing protein [Bryobacteraceae bacterium]